MKSLALDILREQIRRTEKELLELQGCSTKEPVDMSEFDLSKSSWLEHTPTNEGPEYATVLCSLWAESDRIIVEGKPVRNLSEARRIAKSKGYKGIRIEFRRS